LPLAESFQAPAESRPARRIPTLQNVLVSNQESRPWPISAKGHGAHL